MIPTDSIIHSKASSVKGESRKVWNKTIHLSGQWKDRIYRTFPAFSLPSGSLKSNDLKKQLRSNKYHQIKSREGQSEEEPDELSHLPTQMKYYCWLSLFVNLYDV